VTQLGRRSVVRQLWHRMTVVAVAFAASACLPAQAPNCGRIPPDDGCVRVLFIGNSYTFVNNLPGTFAAIAQSLGHSVYADMIAPGGATLADQAKSAEVRDKIRLGHWTFVVLQEQSQIPSSERARQVTMYPAARTLVSEIRHAGARPVFYATWARQNGWPENGLAGYAAMQAQVTLGYRTIAEELHAIVAPVGDAWAAVTAEYADIPLWQCDGSHPTMQGTFLAANVLVATLFHETPRGLGSRGPVPEVHVYRLQQAAARAALGAAPR
jgi:hypothetical protein